MCPVATLYPTAATIYVSLLARLPVSIRRLFGLRGAGHDRPCVTATLRGDERLKAASDQANFIIS